MAFEVSSGAAYAVLYSVLGLFTILAIGSAGFFGQNLPVSMSRLWSLSKADDGSPDYFLAARNSAGYGAIALSYFAGGMGAWVVVSNWRSRSIENSENVTGAIFISSAELRWLTLARFLSTVWYHGDGSYA